MTNCEKCWFPPKSNKAARRLNDLICDINPAEICSQIESDNLKNWCKTIQIEMKMAMVQLPCWTGEWVSRMDEEKLTEQEKAELTQEEIRKEKEEAIIFFIIFLVFIFILCGVSIIID